MKVTCHNFESAFLKLTDSKAPPALSEAVRTHRASCQSCASIAEEYDRLLESFQRLKEQRIKPQRMQQALKKLNQEIFQQRTLRCDQWQSPIGPLFAAVSSHGLCQLSFRFRSLDEFEQSLRRQFQVHVIHDAEAVTPVWKQLQDYFEERRRNFELSIDLQAMGAFQRKVLEMTARVPFGKTATYAEVARRIGRPKAFRAVGNALGRNPIPIIIPCHRVVASDGSLGGYTGGLEIKRKLLKVEGVLPAQHITPTFP